LNATGREFAACCHFIVRRSVCSVSTSIYFFMLGHWQPFAQSWQQSHLQLQFGQSLQQSTEQHLPSLHVGAVLFVVWPVRLAATMPVASKRPLNKLTNIT
jgi:hypothetical protein